MTVANILLLPTSDFVTIYGAWLLGALFVIGLMVMFAWRDEAQGGH